MRRRCRKYSSTNGGWSSRASRGAFRRSRPFVEARDDLQVFETGKIFRDGIVEVEFACFKQRHDRHRCDWLGHGSDRKNSICWHRGVVSSAELARRAFVEHAVAADDECDDARRVAATDSIAQLARQRGFSYV